MVYWFNASKDRSKEADYRGGWGQQRRRQISEEVRAVEKGLVAGFHGEVKRFSEQYIQLGADWRNQTHLCACRQCMPWPLEDDPGLHDSRHVLLHHTC